MVLSLAAHIIFTLLFLGEQRNPDDVKSWICVQIILEVFYTARAFTLFYVYMRSFNPKRMELYLHLVQIYGLWAFTTGWTLYGIVLYNNHIENHAALLTVMWFMLFYNFFTVLFFILMMPKVLTITFLSIKARIYVWAYSAFQKKL